MLVRDPDPCPLDVMDHSDFDSILHAVGRSGALDMEALGTRGDALGAYIGRLGRTDPDRLDGPGALAFWINAYNACVLRTMLEHPDAASLVRTSGALTARRWTICGARLSLDGIEHGKIRRLRDPRAHFAIVCGSASCPSLRAQAYRGGNLDDQLDDQTRSFLRDGGAVLDEKTGVLRLSRLFLWYGGDFAFPGKRPSVTRGTYALLQPRSVLPFVLAHVPEDLAARIEDSSPRIRHQPYDWSLRCNVRPVR